jgi:hypothetical protein
LRAGTGELVVPGTLISFLIESATMPSKYSGYSTGSTMGKRILDFRAGSASLFSSAFPQMRTFHIGLQKPDLARSNICQEFSL